MTMSSNKKTENPINKGNPAAAGEQAKEKNVGTACTSTADKGKAKSTQGTSTSAAKKSTEKPKAKPTGTGRPSTSKASSSKSSDNEVVELLSTLNKNIGEMNQKVSTMWTDMYEPDEYGDQGAELGYDYTSYDAVEMEDGELVEDLQGTSQEKGDDPKNKPADPEVAHVADDENKDGDDDNLFKAVADGFCAVEEKTSPDIDEHLARLINNVFVSGIQSEKYDDLTGKIERPENVSGLRSVQVDSLIWNMMQRPTRSVDEKIQVTQTAMAKAGINVAKMVQLIKSPYRLHHIDDIVKMGTDALAVMGHGFHQLCLRRRELIKPEIDPRFHGLFNPSVAHTDCLFGGNLQEKIAQIGVEYKHTNLMRPKPAFNPRFRRGGQYYGGQSGDYRYQPYNSANRRGNFRGRGRPYNRGRANFGPRRGRGSMRGAHSANNKGKEVSLSVRLTNPDPSPAKANTVIEDNKQKAGRLKLFANKWEQLTSDHEILETVNGIQICFNSEPMQTTSLYRAHFNQNDNAAIKSETESLLKKGVIEEVEHEEGEFISNIFLRKKKNGSYRMILNLKELNLSVEYHHFKMDTFEKAIKMITPNAFMASLDIKDAYYSVPIHKDYRKFLKFMWGEKLFQFTCLPNGLACGPRLYTKMMKPVYATLRSNGHAITGFIDDMLIVGDTCEQVKQSIQATVQLLDNLGFIINYEKSVLIPTTCIQHLGFIIDTVHMKVRLPQDKLERIITDCKSLQGEKQDKIRTVAKVIGQVIATFSAVEWGKLHYRDLEREKLTALRVNYGNFDSQMNITQQMKTELQWWISELKNQTRDIVKSNPDIIMTTDASMDGWGASILGIKLGGRWSLEERKQHINYLELYAAFLALKANADIISDKHVQILSDNSTAVSYMAHMGGKENRLNSLAKDLWNWCSQHRVWLSVSHIPGVENTEADHASRNFNDRIEWELNTEVFEKLTNIFGKPEIDLFATRINTKCMKYVSWARDPDAIYVDAFSRSWANEFNYLFPPFSLIAVCLQKMKRERATGMMILPCWPTQPWFTMFLELLTDTPIILPRTDDLLILPGTNQKHPLRKRLKMLAGRISGKSTETDRFRTKLPTLCSQRGEMGLISNTQLISGDGGTFVCKGKLITYSQL